MFPIPINHISASLAIYTCLTLFVVTTSAAEKAQPPREDVNCRWADAPITIDGKADEKSWQQAELIDNFRLPWLQDKSRPARTATKARLLWDREYLYFFAEMEDSDLYANVEEQDGRLWDNDVFELFFKPADDKPGYYEFQVNAAGTVLDMFLPRRGSGGYERYKDDGAFHVDAKLQLDGTLNKWSDKDNGWQVEGRIPWGDFLRSGGRPTAGETWKFALCRYDYSVDFEGPELSTCAPLSSKNHADFHHWEDYAKLKFIGPDPSSAVKPFGIKKRVALTTSRVVSSPDPLPPYVTERAYPRLTVDFPIYAVIEPGSRRILFIDQDKPYAKTRVCRTRGKPEIGEFDVLLDLPGTAYSIAFHPKFSENGYLFIGWNHADEGQEKTTRITRYTMERKPPFRLLPESALTILQWPSDGHNGGAITFGHDGMLYITSGDGTSDSDTNLKGQGLNHLLAKVLRIDVDHPDGDAQYSVPKDNPFIGQKDVQPETYAYGLRNPWRIATDVKTGDIWIGNNGQDLWEQVYLLKRGANYGWSVYEGSHPFYLNRHRGPTPVTWPAAEHHHSEARSLTGGVVYYGEKLPKLRGMYLYGDYSTGKIWAIRRDGKKFTKPWEIADTELKISGFTIDPDGELLVLDHSPGGGFHRLRLRPEQQPAQPFPRKLSESGLFKSVVGHKMQPGVIPYSVNSPLWSDGAFKQRYIALPGEDPKMDYHPTRSWSFPDGTVLVKSFGLETTAGDPASRKWVETRFFTKQQGEWAGYSYAWNDEQTDGFLVEKQGQDREFTIRTDSGVRKQPWRIPSRAECMVCHSRAANFVLGVSTPQLNRDHDYGGAVDNQLRTLESLGLLRVDPRGEIVNRYRKLLIAAGKSDDEAGEEVAAAKATRDQRAAPTVDWLLPCSPAACEKLADPYDANADLDRRARSYLHVNCASCHTNAGGGNAQFELSFTTKLANTKLVDVKPLHNTFKIPDAQLVAPGEPDRSLLLYRTALRGQGQMPPLATSRVDDAAVEMLRQWIAEMKPPASGER